MIALSLLIVALALVVGGSAGLIVEVLWWGGGFLGIVGAVRVLTEARRHRPRPTDPMDALGGLAELVQQKRTRPVRAEWVPSDRG